MAADFAQISSNSPNYPITPKIQNNSAGFINPNKVQTGQTRGDQQIKGKITVVDANGVVRLVLGYDPGKF